MDCIKCQENLSVYLDGELGETDSATVREHLNNCEPCTQLCQDFSLLLSSCSFEDSLLLEDSDPPNPEALWCRINNIIETEAKPAKAEPEVARGRFSRIWQLSFSQVASAVAGIAVISSLLTFVAINNYNQHSDEDITAAAENEPPSYLTIAMSKLGLAETPLEKRERRIKEQEKAIEYWNKRVQARRVVWDAHIREAFDRNLKVIDESVNEYTAILQKDPDDQLSLEMLNSVLNDKMDLLREFSEL
jgi:hypothetical protein